MGLRTLMIALTTAGMGLFATGCMTGGDGSRQQTTPTAGQIEQEGPITVKDVNQILKNARAYLDQEVSIEGEIAQIYSNSAFTLTTGFVPGLKDRILIVTEEPDVAPAEGEKVSVQGTVRAADFEKLSEDLNLDLPANMSTSYTERVVIESEEIRGLSR